jgi:hypothetical protein
MTTDPIQSTGILGVYSMGVPPAWNTATGNQLGLVGGASMVTYQQDLEMAYAEPERGAAEDEPVHEPLSAADLAAARNSLSFDVEALTAKLREGRDHDLGGAMRECVPAAYLDDAHRQVSAAWERVLADFEKDPLQIGCLEWHRIGDFDVLIHHGPETSEELGRFAAGDLDSCAMWRISFLWTVFMGLMAITGVTAALTNKAKTFISSKVFGNRPLLEVLKANTNTISGTTVFTMIFTLYKFGVLWPLIKIVLTSLSWWAITRLLVKIALKFVGAGVAETIAALVVAAAKVIISWSNKPGDCTLIPA